MSYLFTSESVSEGHPDKVADQISDSILDEFLAFDKDSKVACETLVTTGQVVVSGEITSKTYVDIPGTVRKVINNIGYTKSEYGFQGDSCGILSSIHSQSPDINRGVEREDPLNQGAGDQGMMFGYATNETKDYMPLPIELAHIFLQELSTIRNEKKIMTYLRPDAKSQVTIEYDENKRPLKIHTLVISTQHDDFIKSVSNNKKDTDKADREMLLTIERDIKEILIPRVIDRLDTNIKKLFNADYTLYVNPTGKFVIGGPAGDTGLTGRKIIVDTYGGRAPHGGGAFSGKDPSKVDRSAAYAARHIAKNIVAAGVADEILIQVSYAIGIAQPINIFVNTFGTAKVNMHDSEIAQEIGKIFDMRPKAIIERLKLLNPIYSDTASYGHFGRTPRTVKKVFENYNGKKEIEVELFTWEKLDYVDKIKEVFSL